MGHRIGIHLMKRPIVGAAVLLFLSGCAAPLPVKSHGQTPPKPAQNGPMLLVSPAPNSKAVAKFLPGDSYTILAWTDGGGDSWYQVANSTGTTGWVRRSLLQSAKTIGPIFLWTPRKGSFIRVGQEIEITWSAQSEMGNFNVGLYKQGRFVRVIEENTAAAVGRNLDGTLPDSFTGLLPYFIKWTVPDDVYPGKEYSIRVSDISGAHFDQSPNFSVGPRPEPGRGRR